MHVAQQGLQHAFTVAELVEQSDHDRVQRPPGCFELGARKDRYDPCREGRRPVRMRVAPGEQGIFRQAQDDRVALAVSRQSAPQYTRQAPCLLLVRDNRLTNERPGDLGEARQKHGNHRLQEGFPTVALDVGECLRQSEGRSAGVAVLSALPQHPSDDLPEVVSSHLLPP